MGRTKDKMPKSTTVKIENRRIRRNTIAYDRKKFKKIKKNKKRSRYLKINEGKEEKIQSKGGMTKKWNKKEKILIKNYK